MPRINSSPNLPPASEPGRAAPPIQPEKQPDYTNLLKTLMPTMPADNTRVTPQGRALALSSFLEDSRQAPALNSVVLGAVIRPGDSGDSVKELQKRLSALGYGIAETGEMGPTTSEQLKRFQADHEVAATGEFGPTTLQALQQAEKHREGQGASIEALKKLKPAELHKLGRKDPEAFFKALLPAALESERKSGAPAVMTLVQAAVESDFARSPIGGYNIFGIKGEGPAGTVRLRTREVIKGKNHYVKEPFAKYHNFYEAVKEHGKLYNNGHYDKAMQQYAKDKDVMKFVDSVAKIYATDPNYARTLKTRIQEYGLLDLVNQAR